MLVVAYKINEVLVGNYERDQSNCSGIIIVLVTVVLSLVNVTWAILQYMWYGGCGYNDILITITLVCGIAFYVLVIMRTRKDASILTSALVFTYILYLQWSALASNPNKTCNPFGGSASNTVAQISLGLFFTFICMVVISGSTKSSDDQTTLTQQVNGGLMEDKEDTTGERLDDVEKSNGKVVDQDDMHAFPISSATILFQVLLILCAVYFSQLLTNWGNPSLLATDTTSFFTSNEMSFWIKLVAQWISMLIYLLSLLAPLMFPDREF